ncbi:MAG: DUF11 domain-containing protein [Acidobacteria bacterium]|nr:DUF11 domain-containing protein [Acidobacteriota bacterium]
MKHPKLTLTSNFRLLALLAVLFFALATFLHGAQRGTGAAAAATSIMPASVFAACAAGTITTASSPILYRDLGVANVTDEYVAYKITAPSAISDLWVRLTPCTSCNVTLSTNEDGLYHVGPLGAGVMTTVYFYVHTTAATSTAQSLTLNLFEGNPTSSGTLVCGPNSFNYTIEETIKANANKPDAVVISAGACYVMTETGATGTIGSGNGSIMAFTPAANPSFNADGFQLTSASINLNGTVTNNTLYLSGLASPDKPYTITYTFCPPTPIAAPPAAPVVWVSSGTQIKHTDPDTTSNGTVFLTSSKSVTPTGAVTPGTELTYTITLNNSGVAGSAAATGMKLTDAIPANTTYVANSTKLNGVAVADLAGGVMPYTATSPALEVHSTGQAAGTIAQGATATVVFKVTVNTPPPTFTSVSNFATYSGSNILASNTNTVTTPVPQADLTITKDDSKTIVQRLETTNYALMITNAGPSAVTGALLKDPSVNYLLVTGVSCTGSSGGAVCPSSGVTVANLQGGGISVDLPVNGKLTFTVAVTVAGFTPSQVLTLKNTATITAPTGTTDPTPGNNSAFDENDLQPGQPTAVNLISLTATGNARGATLEWRTGYEADNLGFNVYREERGRRVKLNAALVAGSALLAGGRTVLTAGNSYSWVDSQSAVGASYWLEEVDLNGVSTWRGPIYATSSAEGGKPNARSMTGRQVQMLPDLNEAANQNLQHEWASSATEGLRVEGLETEAPASLLLAQVRQPAWTLPNEVAAKLAVRKTGWYRVTAAQLAAAGFGTNVNAALLQLFADGVEVPVRVVGKGNSFDSLEFYGRGLDSPATDTRIYWLKAGQTQGLRLDTRPGQTAQRPNALSFRSTVERKERLIYFSGLLNGDAENWFGPVISPNGATQKLTTRFVDRTAATSTLELVLQGVTEQAHTINVEINGRANGTITFAGKTRFVTTLNVPASLLLDGENEIRLVATAGSADISLVESVRLSYQRSYMADGNVLSFSLGAGQIAFVGGFSTPTVRVLELGANDEPVRELSVKMQAMANAYGFTLQSDAGARYLALADQQFERVASVKLNSLSDWRATKNSADLVLITHRDFWTAANRLAEARRQQGLRVAVVDVEDAYDEFCFGAKAPQALKDLLTMARTTWAVKPAFVLLVGDATTDPRDYLGLGNADFVPTKLGATTYFETALDNWLADGDDDGLPELALGRLPVRTAAQADALVAKILTFKPNAANPRPALLVSDRTVDGVNYQTQSQEYAASLLPLMTKYFVNRNDGAPDQVRAQILNTINLNQPLVVNWGGHGSTQVWTGDGLLRVQDAASLTNAAPSLFVMTTCLNGYFPDPSQTSLGEAVLLNAPGGAFAVVSSSALNTPGPQYAFNLALYQSLFSEGKTLGEALTAARLAAGDKDVRNSYVLLGDPTLRLR